MGYLKQKPGEYRVAQLRSLPTERSGIQPQTPKTELLWKWRGENHAAPGDAKTADLSLLSRELKIVLHQNIRAIFKKAAVTTSWMRLGPERTLGLGRSGGWQKFCASARVRGGFALINDHVAERAAPRRACHSPPRSAPGLTPLRRHSRLQWLRVWKLGRCPGHIAEIAIARGKKQQCGGCSQKRKTFSVPLRQSLLQNC